MIYHAGELDGAFRNISCSSMSPLSHSMSIEEGQLPTDDCARMILSLPVTNWIPHAGVAPCCLVAGVAKMHELSLCQSAVEIIR